jgi:hypothetical protein
MILNLLNQYSAAASVIALIGGGFWALLKFREYLKDKRFHTYHELIDELVDEQRHPDKVIKLDKQITVVFELRNFPSYYSVTKRILTDLKSLWIGQPRIIKEIDLTLVFISKNWFARSWDRFWKI